MTNSSDSALLFFLGAGASVEADVPDTFGLVQEFRKSIRGRTRLRNEITLILRVLREWRSDQGLDDKVDVELLLETLDKLRSRNREVLLRFFKIERYLLSGLLEKEGTIDDLRRFIKKRAVVSASVIHYLKPFLEFIEQFGPLDVFSVNYDTAIEQFCASYKKNLTDGFDFKWNPKSLDEKHDVRLHKLHGSITWFRTQSGEYIKSHTLSERESIELVTGERADSLILYPTQKWEYAEPLLELLVRLGQKLERASCCVVVGYSFRDDQIRRIFWDAAQRNPGLQLVLIGPRASTIYRERLQFYENGQNYSHVPSALNGRVVCLPYKFGSVFGSLRKIQRQLDIGRTFEDLANKERLSDPNRGWEMLMTAVKGYVEGEHVEKVDEIFANTDWDSVVRDWKFEMEVSFKVWIHSLLREAIAWNPNLWAGRFLNSLVLFRNPRIFVDETDVTMNFMANSIATPAKSFYEPVSLLREWIMNLLGVAEGSADILPVVRKLADFEVSLDNLASCFYGWGSTGALQIQEYVDTKVGRQKAISKRLLRESQALKTKASSDTSALKRIVEEIEFARIKNVLSEVEATIHLVKEEMSRHDKT